jgi:PhnB protein
MMWLNPYLMFNGQCETAFKFYEKCLLGKIVVIMMRYADTPMAEQMPPEWGQKIIHATLICGDHRLQGADAPPANYLKPQGFSVLLNLDTAAEADRIFATLAEKGVEEIPVQETFWALRFGTLIDQFGTPWLIQCGKPA